MQEIAQSTYTGGIKRHSYHTRVSYGPDGFSLEDAFAERLQNFGRKRGLGVSWRTDGSETICQARGTCLGNFFFHLPTPHVEHGLVCGLRQVRSPSECVIARAAGQELGVEAADQGTARDRRGEGGQELHSTSCPSCRMW